MPPRPPALPEVDADVTPADYLRLTRVFTIPVIDELAAAYGAGAGDVVAARAAGIRPVDLALLLAVADLDEEALPTHAARALARVGRDLLAARARTAVRALGRVRRAGRADWKAAFALADRMNAVHVEGDAPTRRGGAGDGGDLDDAIASLLARGTLRAALGDAPEGGG